MKNIFNGKLKRIMAAALSLMVCIGLVPTPAFAAGETAQITFAYMYQSDGSQILYQDSFVGTHGTDGGYGHTMTQIYANGEEAYCIEPGAPLHTGDSLTANASETWNNLGGAKQEAIKMALAFGKPGNAGSLTGSGDSKHLATQMVVWEIVCGYRDAGSYAVSNNCIYNAFCKGGANAEVAANYHAIESAMKTWFVTPSFADNKTHAMSWKDGKYTLTMTDQNGVLAAYSVSSSDSKVKITKNGNQITLTSDSYIANNPTITVSKSSGISASAILVPYGSASLQDVVSGVTRVGDVNAAFKVNTPGGTLKLVKTSEDGIVSGIKMTVTGNNYNKTVTTGDNGTISIEGLIPGTYTVSEAVSNYYEPQQIQTVTITSGETATVTFKNVLKRGDLSVSKTSEDGFTEGMKFRLFGTSASGSSVDLYAVTDSNGIATFEDVLIAGVSGYTLEEVDTAIRYVIPEDQNVTVAWNEVTSSTVTNILKKFNVTVNKYDIENGTAQGDASLAGAVYALYHNGELVDSFTTDSNGSFTTGYYVCDSTWSVKEITPSEGYLLDPTEYHVGAEPENYEVEFNAVPVLNSYEQVIKGNVSIIKHADDGSTQIETPEEGASFMIYLASAGSYENAKESERDILICDEDGFAQSKDLPYGLYTVHQTAGFPETEFMKDFTVFISENGKTYKYLINNAPYSAYIKVVKADAETGNTIPMTGAGFEIYDAYGSKVSMSYTYPTLTTIDTFYVSEDGYLITPQKLDAGNYSLVEVQAPYGYVLNSDPIPFTVTSADNEDVEGLCVITVTAYDMAQKGTITITKSGEVFASVSVSGEEGVIDKEGNWGVINPTYQAVYEVRNLSGATYQVIAAEDIYTGDGTLRVAAGTVVADMTTNGDGVATTDELYLGKYCVVETEAPFGYTLNEEEQIVELTYAGQEISLTTSSASYVNDRQKLELSVEKEMEQNETFGIGMNGEITAVSFGLYAKEDIVAVDESVIPADGLMEIAFADENGHVSFTSDLPFGTYYVKELSTDVHYNMNDAVYEVSFEYCGQDTAIQTIALNDGEAIENDLKYGRIEGYKFNDVVADGEEKGLEGAVFGLFKEGTMDLTSDNAVMFATSDENGYFVFGNVPYGDYLVVELTAPEGYVLSDARHFVSITYDTQVIGLKVINYPIIGSVELTKIDKDYPENHLAGATFELYKDVDADGELGENDALIGNLTEYEGGIYRQDGLRKGSYLVREKTAPEGFLLDENVYAFAIEEDGQVAIIENEAGVGFMNQVKMGKLTIYKTDKATGDKLVGAGFRVCDMEGNTVAEAVTGEDGTVSFDLRYGKYTVAEYKAPEGYVLDETPYAFEVTEDGQVITVDMSNTKISGKLVISKVDADTEKLLPDAGFRIYAADGKTVIKEGRTDKKGVCEFELEFGKYFYQEFDAPDGYEIDDTMYEFSITEDGKIVSVVMTNKKTPETPKEDPKPTETPKPTPKPSTDDPKTGDESNIGLWSTIAALALAGACVGGIFLYRGEVKKKDGKKKN
jgi:uncharacterized surface anchored protein